MDTKDFRAAVFSEIETWALANFPAVPFIFENGPVPDEDKIGPTWVDVSIRWYGSQPMGIGEVVTGRHSGVVSLQVYHRQGLGSGLPDDIIDGVEPLLKTRRIGTAILYFPQRNVPTDIKGWYKAGCFFPFTLDR